MTEALYLTLDQGGHASRAILYDAQGRELAQAFAPIATRRLPQGRVEHDPEEIIDSLRTALHDLLAEIKPATAAAIAAAGLATQRSSVVCWNRATGVVLSPVISWQDRRNAALVEQLHPHAARIHQLTGLVLSPHYGASKLRWCLENLTAVQEAASNGELAFGPLSSFILFRLLEEQPFLVDPANASRTQLWNPRTGHWESQLLNWFGIADEHLPQPVASRHDFGTLSLGSSRVPLTVCTGDQAAVPYAFGPARPETACLNLGTGAFMLRPLTQAVSAPPLLSSILWSDKAGQVTFALEGTVNGAGSALQWYAEQAGLEVPRMLNSLGKDADEQLRPPLFLNGISGLGSPFWIADFPSRFEGKGDAREKFVAVLESILFLLRLNLDAMRLHEPALRELIVTGGLSASDFVCQSLADLCDLPVVRYQEREATARGLAFLLAGAPEGWVRPAAERFEPRLNTGVRERYFAWLKVMKSAVGN